MTTRSNLLTAEVLRAEEKVVVHMGQMSVVIVVGLTKEAADRPGKEEGSVEEHNYRDSQGQ